MNACEPQTSPVGRALIPERHCFFPGEEATLSSHIYDGFGRRRLTHVQHGALTKTTWWRYAGWSILSEHEENPEPTFDWVIGARTRTYVPGLAQVPGSNPSTGSYQYFYTDHLGSVRTIRGQNKATLATYEYSPYGEAYHTSGLPLNFGYTGHLWDPTMGMYWAPYRYYIPGNARWNMRDPIPAINSYNYVGNNPLLYTDKLGLRMGCKPEPDVDPDPGKDKDNDKDRDKLPGRKDDTIKDQIRNIVDTAKELLKKIATRGKGVGVGVEEGAKAAETAAPVTVIWINQKKKDDYIYEDTDDIPPCAGGGNKQTPGR